MNKREVWALVAAWLVVALVAGGYFWHKHASEATAKAETYCSWQDDVPSRYSTEFKNCVDDYLKNRPR